VQIAYSILCAGSADMHKVIVQKKDDDQAVARQAIAGKTAGLDLTAYQRQKELTQREAKKKMLVAFVAENECTFDYIKQAFQYYADLPKERRIKGRIKFPDFCKALNVEPISEYRILHSLFDNEESQEVDFREVLLSMMNFIDVNKELRIRFSFTMFDDKKTGYITQKEVEEILRGNHMISLASVARKAETIMKQATASTSGSITMNELVVIAKKFPNILLPTIGATAAK
jgi:Ca2+-binding EF-hand superfamily protein